MRSLKLENVKSSSVIFFIVFFITISFILPINALRADQPSNAILAGAKKEGQLSFYTSTSLDDSEALLKAFRNKYPYIKTRLYRASGDRLMAKTMTEARAKKHLWDVMINGGLNTETLKREGYIAKYISPENKFFPEASKDPEGYWTDVYPNIVVIAYNTRLVSAADAPKTWNDLLDPKWKGKMGITTNPFSWFTNMMRILGEEKGIAYMENLSSQNLKVRRGTTLNAQLMVAGEFSIGIALYNHTIEELKAKGAPVEWVATEPVIQVIHPIFISANATNPNAAKLFVDFVLSKEGQQMMASFYRIPSRLDVDAMVPSLKCKGKRFMPFDPKNVDDYERYVKLFNKIFIKK